MSTVAPHRNRLKGKHSAAPDDESVSYLASIFEENLQMQETHDCSELLFQFSFIELGEFEMVLDFVDSFRTISLLEAARIFWLQARRTLERLQNDRDDNMELAKQKMQPVRKEDGERMAKELGAVKYVECSALTQYKLKDVFDEVRRQTPCAVSRCGRSIGDAG